MHLVLLAALLSTAAACGPGREFSTTTTACTACHIGKYRDTTARCIPCPDNSTTQYTGATTIAECTLCLSNAVYTDWHKEQYRAICSACEGAPKDLGGHRRTRCATQDWGSVDTYMHAGFRNLDAAVLRSQTTKIRDTFDIGTGSVLRTEKGFVYYIPEESFEIDPYRISTDSYTEKNGQLSRLRYDDDCEPLQIWNQVLRESELPIDQALIDARDLTRRVKDLFCSNNAIKDSLYTHVLPMHTLGAQIISNRHLLYDPVRQTQQQILRMDPVQPSVNNALQYYDLRPFLTRKYIDFLHVNFNASSNSFMQCLKQNEFNAFEAMWDEFNIARMRYLDTKMNTDCLSLDQADTQSQAITPECYGDNLYDIPYTEVFCRSKNTTLDLLNDLLHDIADKLMVLLHEESLNVSIGTACIGHDNRTLWVEGVRISGDEANITVPGHSTQVTVRVESVDGLCSATRILHTEPHHVQRHFYHTPGDDCTVAKLVDGADFSRVWEDLYLGSHVAPSIRENIAAVLRRYPL